MELYNGVELWDDMVMFEHCTDEWKEEQNKSKIITPDTIQKKKDGEFAEKCPMHFFRVVAKGPDCKHVEMGDRVIPTQPDLYHQPSMQPAVIYLNGEPVMRYIIKESNLGGRMVKAKE